MMTDGLISIAEAQGNAAAIESMATLLNELATWPAHVAGRDRLAQVLRQSATSTSCETMRHAMTLTWADAVVTLAMILAVIAIVWLVRRW